MKVNEKSTKSRREVREKALKKSTKSQHASAISACKGPKSYGTVIVSESPRSLSFKEGEGWVVGEVRKIK